MQPAFPRSIILWPSRQQEIQMQFRRYATLFCTVSGMFVLPFGATKAEPDPVCTTVLQCTEIAAAAVQRAEAAVAAMQRPAIVTHLTASRSLSGVYQNKTGRTKIVIVAASKDAPANTMFGNIAVTPGELPSGTGPNAQNGATVTMSSFVNNAY